MNGAAAVLAHPIGVAIGDMTPPEAIPATARWLEELGYSHLVVPEDCWYLPAQICATLALGATSIPVGTSIVSAMTRHPAILAMEIAGISRAFPGRFRPGIGLGLPEWLVQMGLMPEKPVAAMRECVSSVQRLLEGETVSLDGKSFTLEEIGITHLPTEKIPITLGVMGEQMLQLSGRLADATLFPATAGLDYFHYAKAQVQTGLEKAGRPPEAMAYSTIALACVDRDGAKARERARPIMGSFLAEFASMNTITAYGISEELTAILERGGAESVSEAMPDRWLEDLALVGTPEEVAEKVTAWVQAGISSICIFLPHESERETLTLVAEEVLPMIA
jgi:5,10-methylenetetrahydromethanopterin reductase